MASIEGLTLNALADKALSMQIDHKDEGCLRVLEPDRVLMLHQLVLTFMLWLSTQS